MAVVLGGAKLTLLSIPLRLYSIYRFSERTSTQAAPTADEWQGGWETSGREDDGEGAGAQLLNFAISVPPKMGAAQDECQQT